MDLHVLFVGEGVPLLNLAVSIADYIVIILLAAIIGRGRITPDNQWMAKVIILLYATLAVLTAAGPFIIEAAANGGSGDEVAFLVRVVALTMRFGILLLLGAWAWQELEQARENRAPSP